MLPSTATLPHRQEWFDVGPAWGGVCQGGPTHGGGGMFHMYPCDQYRYRSFTDGTAAANGSCSRHADNQRALDILGRKSCCRTMSSMEELAYQGLHLL